MAVNRVWQHLFGQGLVGTPDDFGTRGERPSHPALLDHLARSFMRQGWSMKRLIRQVVLSRTYQLSSRFDRAAAARDPENRWHWRMNRRRLEVEALRDGLLAVSGQLDRSPAESVVADLNVQATGVGVKPNKPVRSVAPDGLSAGGPQRPPAALPALRLRRPAVRERAAEQHERRAAGAVHAEQPVGARGGDAHGGDRAGVGRRRAEEREVLDRLYVRILGRPPRRDEVGPSLDAGPRGAAGLAAAARSAVDDTARARAWSILSHALFCSTSFRISIEEDRDVRTADRSGFRDGRS